LETFELPLPKAIGAEAVFLELADVILIMDYVAEFDFYQPVSPDVLDKAAAHLAAAIVAGCLPVLRTLKIYGQAEGDAEAYARFMSEEYVDIPVEEFNEEQRRYQKAYLDATSVLLASEKVDLEGICRERGIKLFIHDADGNI
jgi:hypothetical protein